MADTIAVNAGTGPAVLTDEVTSVNGGAVSARHAQQVKVGHGADGAYNDIAATSPLEVRLYAAGGTAISDDGSGRIQVKSTSDQWPSALVGGRVDVNVGAAGATVPVDSELPAAAALSDTAANPTVPAVGAFGMAWNGTEWERTNSNRDITVLASAARTATTSSLDQTNRGAAGAHIMLDVTSVGTGSLGLRVSGRPGGGTTGARLITLTGITGATSVIIYPGATATNLDVLNGYTDVGVLGVPLPRKWFVTVVPTDASSWTYQILATMIHT